MPIDTKRFQNSSDLELFLFCLCWSVPALFGTCYNVTMETLSQPQAEVGVDMAGAVDIIRNVAEWMQGVGLVHDGWWEPENMNVAFLGQYAKPDEFFVARLDGKPAAAAIIQAEQSLQDWGAVDNGSTPPALYLHYVAVEREFAGRGLPRELMQHAENLAKEKGIPALRLDTNADESKLRKVYEDFGFKEVKILEEDGNRTVLYEKQVAS